MRPAPDNAHAIRELPNVFIPLADGCRLAARVWMPEDAERRAVPAVLEYTPYRKDDHTACDDLSRHPFFAAHGYASVRVDLRGTGDSDGILCGEYLPQEQDDALEVLRWIAEQPWCSGRVGMIGYSWGGFNGLQIAARRPPELAAVVTVDSTDDRYADDCHYMGGCLLGSDMLKWSATMLAYAAQPPDPRFVGSRWRSMWRERLEQTPSFAEQWITHQRRDTFWKHGSIREDYAAIGCPVYAFGGWADAYTNAVPRLVERLVVPRLGVIGPWAHMMPDHGVPGPAIGFLEECVRWWDRWLRSIDNGVDRQPALTAWVQDPVPPARFYDERPGRWAAFRQWPIPSAHTWSLTLAACGVLAGADAGTSTASDSSIAVASVQHCGEQAGVWCANGLADELPADQSADDDRSTTFETPPLEADLEVLGAPLLVLDVAADRPLALVAARVEDVAPDGTSLLVSWGLLNLTHRESDESPQPLQPGRRSLVRVQLRVCGHRFAAGHRLRLALSPTYWPHAWPSPEPVELEVGMAGLSVLELPLLPRADELAERARRFPDPERVAYANQCPPYTHDRTRTVESDDAARIHRIRDCTTSTRSIPPSLERYRQENVDEWEIRDDEPLSATVECLRDVECVRADWAWRIQTRSRMTCDAERFYVSESVVASEAGVEHHVAKRSFSVPRDLV